ncbi:MaoC/PaaZ C-terminal domain-containing protein [Streptomyces sp. AC627_RSS907]|uniref:MaoC family dehydratase n=1 Tax=Streptomyces sp. AC627_RSS907 TaxID=2823684 RepID=UPI0027E3E250|nr:MaoC/PaaZ C-terminal domain-containing protein [Streptomyces sp. AC627_RSS907]
MVPARTFEDLRVGEVFRAPSRTLTDAHAAAFQTVSADNHPVHYDAKWARRHGHTAPVVHGLQVLAFTAPGATLFPALTVTDLRPQGDNGVVTTEATIHNQRGELVLSGQHTYLLRRR